MTTDQSNKPYLVLVQHIEPNLYGASSQKQLGYIVLNLSQQVIILSSKNFKPGREALTTNFEILDVTHDLLRLR